MRNYEIMFIVKPTISEDDIGNSISSSNTSKKCYAKKQSVRQNEFYNATMVGLTPSCEFVIKRLNYSGQNELEWNNERFEIIRTTDPKNKFDIVLVCSKKIGVNKANISA